MSPAFYPRATARQGRGAVEVRPVGIPPRGGAVFGAVSPITLGVLFWSLFPLSPKPALEHISPGWLCAVLLAALPVHWLASAAADPAPRLQVSDSLVASATRLETILERLALQLPAQMVGSVRAELALGAEASPSRLLQACRDLQDASANQLMPEIRPLFASLRDHALMLGGPGETRPPCSAGGNGKQTNLFVDLPVLPLPTLADHPVARKYHVVRDEAGARITSTGSGQMVLGLRLGESGRGVAMHVSIAGTGSANLHGRRGRVDMRGLLRSHLSAATLVQLDQDGLWHGPPRVSVDNRIDLVNVAFHARSPLVRRLGGHLASRVLDGLVPELTDRSEREMRRELARESDRLLKDAASQFEVATAPISARLSREAGISLALGGTVVDASARVAILANIDASLPAADPTSPPPLANDRDAGRLEIHLHESLPTRLADLAGGAMLLETDFRELCLEPLGMVPEFDPEVQFGVEAARVRLAVVRPVTVSFDEGSFAVDVRLDSYQTGDGEPAGPARIVASYEG